jgi:RNA polymerase sigma-70 factor (ECF subfamily)
MPQPPQNETPFSKKQRWTASNASANVEEWAWATSQPARRSMNAPATDQQFSALLTRARTGDTEALGVLVRTYESEVRIVARVLLGPALRPHLDSLDLIQSVHRSLMAGLRQEKFDISTPENLVALALTMVRRKVARKWRQVQRQERLSRGPAGADELVATLTNLTSREGDPAGAAEINDALRRVCNDLTPADRQLMELRLAGCTTAEAARELGADPDVLRAHLSRLRQHLRTAGILSEWI